MIKKVILITFFVFIFGSLAIAEEPIDLIGGSDEGDSGKSESGYILDAAWNCADPFGEFDPELGAAAALNRSLGLIFSGHASTEQISLENELISEFEGDHRMAPFAVYVLEELQDSYAGGIPEPMALYPFDLSPGSISIQSPQIVAVKYDREEYLERLLQRLYFKLIQGPVLITVPYCGNSPAVPEEYRDWNNFRYASDGNTMDWNDTRLVYVDWSLTQTVVLSYEDGLIACYDSGNKYYIDHTAAVAAAGAMTAHPDYSPDIPLNYVLTSADD